VDILAQCRVETDVDEQHRLALQSRRPAILSIAASDIHAVDDAFRQRSNHLASDESTAPQDDDWSVIAQSFEQLYFSNHLLYGFNRHIGFWRFSNQPPHEKHPGKNSRESLVTCAEKLPKPFHSFNEPAELILVSRIAELAVVGRDGELNANLAILPEEADWARLPLVPSRPIGVRIRRGIVVSSRIDKENGFENTDPLVNQSD